MAKSRKKAAADEPSPLPQVGDKVTVGTDSIYAIAKVHYGGGEVDLQFPGTNLMRFRVPVDKLTYVKREPPTKTSNPFTTSEPAFDAGEVIERIATVKEENLKRLDDDVDILTVGVCGLIEVGLCPRLRKWKASGEPLAIGYKMRWERIVCLPVPRIVDVAM
jgi:hypothetical protein